MTAEYFQLSYTHFCTLLIKKNSSEEYQWKSIQTLAL